MYRQIKEILTSESKSLYHWNLRIGMAQCSSDTSGDTAACRRIQTTGRAHARVKAQSLHQHKGKCTELQSRVNVLVTARIARQQLFDEDNQRPRYRLKSMAQKTGFKMRGAIVPSSRSEFSHGNRTTIRYFAKLRRSRLLALVRIGIPQFPGISQRISSIYSWMNE
jgi:hypothetical protein